MDRPFPTSSTLTAVALAYRNSASMMLHKLALPSVPVLTERFTWLSYPIAEAFTVPDMEVGRRGKVNQVEFSAEEHDGRVRDFGLDDVIPITDIEEASKARTVKSSTYDPEAHAVSSLANLVLLGREIRASTIVQATANYDAERRTALVGTAKFSDFENSDPFEVLDEGMRKPLVHRANTIIMGEVVWEKIKKHPKLLKAVKGNLADEGAISRKQFAELMEIDPDRFGVGVSMVNTAAKGQPISLEKVWGNSISLLYVDNTKSAATDSVLTWGFTAELGSREAGSIPAPEVGLKGGRRIRVGEQVNEIVCAKSLGYLIADAVAI